MKSKTLLGLRDNVTLKEIKHNYKSLMKKWHPDKHPNKELATTMSSQINEAYETIMEYIENYEYSFEEEFVKRKTITPQEWWHNQFHSK
jgi:DnaJ-class molecular chaperone